MIPAIGDQIAIDDGGESSFLDSAVGAENLPPGITGRTVHKIR